MELTQDERDRQEFIQLLIELKERDPKGFPAICAQIKAVCSGEVTEHE